VPPAISAFLRARHEREGVEIKLYRIIYEAVADVRELRRFLADK